MASIGGTNTKYQAFVQQNIGWFSRNSKKIDRVRLYCADILTEENDNKIRNHLGSEEEKFKVLYTILGEAGFSKIDVIIEALNQTQQIEIADAFVQFKKENKAPQREGQQKDGRFDNTVSEDVVDFIHNEEPLNVVVRKATAYVDANPNTSYKMVSDPRGFALMINNIEYYNSDRTRRGAEQDREHMLQLLQQLGYEVTLKENVKFIEIKEILKTFKQQFIHKDVDSCLVVVMSHGGANTIELIDGEDINLWQDVIYKFNNDVCPQLIGKPKIFIIQACQEFENPIPRTGFDASQPLQSDILVCFATLPGQYAYRDSILGSWYIYCLTKVFMENAHKMDIKSLLEKITNDTMMRMENPDDRRQISTYLPIAFSKKFFFNPGL